jgi:hypothetical protein
VCLPPGACRTSIRRHGQVLSNRRCRAPPPLVAQVARARVERVKIRVHL